MSKNSQFPVIECQQLKKSFRVGSETIDVLRGIDFSLNKGESVAIVGSSGAGKTTLLSLLGGLEKPSDGEVLILGKTLGSLSDKQRTRLRNKNIGFVYQLHHLLQEFTASENVQLPLLLAGIPTTQAKEQAEDMLKEVSLEKRLKHKPAELSGGERQRVAIARALVNKPACVLMDEPTGNLDRTNAEHVITLLLELCNNLATALVLVTHDLELANRLQQQRQLRDGVLTQT